MGCFMQNFRSLGQKEQKLHHFSQKPKLFFLEIGKNKSYPIKMFAKQKSYLIIDIEKQKKISGVSDAQEKNYKLFKV